MKHLFMAVALVGFLAGSVFAQGERGNLGQVYNQATTFYTKANATPSTANETTTWLPIIGASDMAVFGSCNDSAAALIYYRLKASKGLPYAVTGSWTAIDTLGPAGDGTMATTSGASQRLGTILLTTLVGYDQIQFYVDYLTGQSAGDVSASTTKFYYFYLKPSSVR